jgi:hypothetical protein
MYVYEVFPTPAYWDPSTPIPERLKIALRAMVEGIVNEEVDCPATSATSLISLKKD